MKKNLLFLMLMAFLFPLTMNAQEIIVGEATDNKNVAPFVNSYPNSWAEIIYTVEEIGQACNIGSIAFQYAEGPTLTANDIKVYLAETTKSEFANKSDWTPEEELKLVYSGTNVVLGDDAWETFEFDTPFEYSGEKNLAVVVAKTAGGMQLQLTWGCYDAEKAVMFTGSDTDPAFAQYPTSAGLAVYGKKPVMKLIQTENAEEPTRLEAPKNLRAIVEQDLPDYTEYKYKITMEWDAVEGAQGYDVYVNTTAEKDFYFGYTGGTAYIAGTNQETVFEFYVIAFNDDPSADSEPSEVCTVTVVDDAIEEMNASFNIYPNPVNDRLYIETESEIEEVVVYDVYGRQQLAVSGQQSAVSVANLNSGVYFVKVVTSEGETVKRFIKD